MACLEIPKPQNWRPKRAARDGWDDSEYTRRMTHLLSLLLTWGCSAPEPAGNLRLKAGDAHHATKRAADDPDADSDGDGVRNADDCEPHDRYSFPGANGHCDGIDNDCDGTVDFGTRPPPATRGC